MQSSPQEIEVTGHSYQSKIRWMDSEIMRVQRVHRYTSPKMIDAVGSQWVLAFLQKTEGKASLLSGNKRIPLPSPCVLFLAPFSVIEWGVPVNEELCWTAFFSDRKIESQPLISAWTRENISPPRNRAELEAIVHHIQGQGEKIETPRKASPGARKLKSWIDRNFTESAQISVAARELGRSRMVLSREFRAAYGLSPVQYRHRIRLFESLRLMNHGLSVTEAAFAVGFSDPSQFFVQFQKFLGTAPIRYRVSPSL